MNATIRKANAEDAVAAWEIRNAAILSGCKGYYPPHLLDIWTSGEVSERFVRFVAGQFYVATINDVVVGTGLIDINNGQLDAIFVRPDKMGRGVGRRIVSFLESVGLASGLTNLKLDSTLNAAKFYRRCGFVGEELGAYKSPRGIVLECIPMTKSLSQPPASG